MQHESNLKVFFGRGTDTYDRMFSRRSHSELTQPQVSLRITLSNTHSPLGDNFKRAALRAQELEKARSKASEAASAVKGAEKQLTALETAVPKARMEAESLRATACDLSQRLVELKAATKASMYKRLPWKCSVQHTTSAVTSSQCPEIDITLPPRRLIYTCHLGRILPHAVYSLELRNSGNNIKKPTCSGALLHKGLCFLPIPFPS